MRVHFIAIGGSIMHNLAIALAKKGYMVSGSDDHIYEPSRTNLANEGLLPEPGWDPAHITADIDAVVLGMHAKADNPELLKAKELGVRIYSYPEFIYEQTMDKTRVVIGGSHGKTTITSIIMHVLKSIGRDFDYLVGAKLDEFEYMVRLTKDAPLMIIEGDEYLASPIDQRPKFHLYRPHIALISGIAWDHVNVFPTFENYVTQFRLFIKSIEPKGTLVYNKEDKRLQELVLEDQSKINKHGYRTPEYTINKGITYMHTHLGDIPLQVFGRHNLSNIAAAFTVCEWLGVEREAFYEAIKQFKGASRRLEYVASNNDSVVYQDFAHTPTKLKASIHALKEQFPGKALVAIIELHTYSSLNKAYLNEYMDTMQEAEYPAVFINQEGLKQKNAEAISEDALKKAFNQPNLIYFNSIDGMKQYLVEMDPAGKNLLFMSSGNYGGVNLVNFADKFLYK
ncbi:peptidoglycan synthetase [Parapedobacter sp. ISTM3]|uniref:UDP-N-acetylmuramate: L-alanyl-gamma-D-glutamyl-meso-diaminopimelate ligase n=1 Tax=Parapedobacter luteus TaxID=623280 RepID=A0A1T5AQK0_9SPHI|nr:MULTISPECIES: Mur ligase family protein [Parapedobacter]MBK1441937.1 peptidoglycan synthetase [Parapedobacter sp. ISTM3]SKB36873.1 UDP-N-acetylmuramate: L-alanyl-gamma-D-glutamyl-meso-diaminopimelate ligase [Parapedobacter luteus]